MTGRMSKSSRKASRRPLWVAALLPAMATVTGCAHAPAPQIVQSGALPPGGASYALVETDGAKPASGAAIAQCLGNRGMTVSDAPAYLAQISESDRPGKAVAYPADPKPEKGQEPQWLPGSAPGRGTIRSLALTLTDAATGREVYRVTASERHSRKDTAARGDEGMAKLAGVACAGMVGG
jgi:hypothetical protein